MVWPQGPQGCSLSNTLPGHSAEKLLRSQHANGKMRLNAFFKALLSFPSQQS